MLRVLSNQGRAQQPLCQVGELTSNEVISHHRRSRKLVGRGRGRGRRREREGKGKRRGRARDLWEHVNDEDAGMHAKG